MFAEPRIGDPERVEVARAALEIERKAEADRGVGVGLIDQYDVGILPGWRVDDGIRWRRSLGQARKRCPSMIKMG
jgi:hypothetical protein